MTLHFYDFEVFKYEWLVVIKDPINKTTTHIHNDADKLRQYYEQHVDDIWVGFNSRDYDQYILKAIMLGIDPKKVSDFIIAGRNKGWQYSKEFNRIPFNNYDVFLGITDKGLKTHAAFKGHAIHETDVSFDIDRPLTAAELAAEFEYCENDVDETIDDFIERKSEFDFMMFFINHFKLPLSLISKTRAQLMAHILGAKGIKFNDEFEYRFMPTVKIEKYTQVLEFYRNVPKDETTYNRAFNIDVAGCPHTFAWGGLHGAIKKYFGEGFYILADAEMYYPESQVRYKIGYRQLGNPENFEFIHESNGNFKRSGDKIARQPFKIGDNAIGGQLKDKTSKLYDPRESNTMLINCQLWLLDLNEKLEATGRFQLIQSNTDGIVWKLKNLTADFELFDDIVHEWECRTGFKMGFELVTKIYQKDVNNYVLTNGNKIVKKIGAYTKDLSRLDYDLAIVNQAMVEYMVNGVAVEKTVNECQEYRAFMKVVKVSSKYQCGFHNGIQLNDKTFRVFASNDPNDSIIGKRKESKLTIEKFANTPDHCFIDNGLILDKPIPSKLDRQWYIDLVKERLRQYGVKV